MSCFTQCKKVVEEQIVENAIEARLLKELEKKINEIIDEKIKSLLEQETSIELDNIKPKLKEIKINLK